MGSCEDCALGMTALRSGRRKKGEERWKKEDKWKRRKNRGLQGRRGNEGREGGIILSDLHKATDNIVWEIRAL